MPFTHFVQAKYMTLGVEFAMVSNDFMISTLRIEYYTWLRYQSIYTVLMVSGPSLRYKVYYSLQILSNSDFPPSSPVLIVMGQDI